MVRKPAGRTEHLLKVERSVMVALRAKGIPGQDGSSAVTLDDNSDAAKDWRILTAAQRVVRGTGSRIRPQQVQQRCSERRACPGRCLHGNRVLGAIGTENATV